MSFSHLSRGHVVAAVAALALLLVMAVDWYGTKAGDAARAVEQQTQPSGAEAGEVGRAVDADAKRIAAAAEDNAWQADQGIDRVILFVLLTAAGLATAAAWLRAANVRFQPPWTPSAAATLVGLAGALLVAGRIAQKPAADAGAVVKLGAPLGLVCVGVLALGARAAWRAESEAETAFDHTLDTTEREPEPEPALAAAAAPSPPLWSPQGSGDWAPDWTDDQPGDADAEPEPSRGRRWRLGRGRRS